MKNVKKCKGNGIAVGWGCGTPQINRKYGLGLACGCYTRWLLTSKAGREKLYNSTIKAKHRVTKEKQEKIRQYKRENKSIASLIQETRKVFQEYIRLRDINDACISCGTTEAEIYDAGHFFKAELYSGLIFDELNCNKQCRKCNTFLNGNESGYALGLERKIGTDAFLGLKFKSNHFRTHKYSREELSELKSLYKEKLKNLKSKYNESK